MAVAAAEAQMAPPAGRPIRVMIVDDSMVARTAARRALAGAVGVEIVASVGDGKAAVNAVAAAQPDVLLLDIEMPIMNGLDALPLLLGKRPGLKIVIVSTMSKRNAEISLKAMRAGAVDVLLKPSADATGASMRTFEEELRRTVLSLGAAIAPGEAPQTATTAAAMARKPVARRTAQANPSRRRGPMRVTALAIGSSTGGPQALAKVLDGWGKRGLKQPIFITQHMPPTFTGILAEHLSRSAGMTAAEGVAGEAVTPGRIYIAPGDRHMLIEASAAGPVIRLNDGPQVNFCRPAVDPMFASLAEVYRDGLLAAVLTGMGRDGRDGAEVIRAAGGHVVVQDEVTSVVWGMPGAVATAGLADEILPLTEIGPALAALAQGGATR